MTKEEASRLAPAIMGDRKNLSDAALAEIRSMMGPAPLRFLWEIAKVWIVVVAVISTAVYFNNLVFSVFAIFVVATRQNILGLLMHEQAHYLGFKGKYGDLITDLLVCYPLLVVSVKNYANVHLSHHKYFLTKDDPDLHRKSGKDWTFPAAPQKLAKLFFLDLFGLNFLANVRGKNVKSTRNEFNRKWQTPAFVKPLYLLIAATLITLTHSWSIILLYWLLPLLTIFQVIVRWGAIREHWYIKDGKLEDTTPIIQNSWLEEFILPQKNFCLHIYHHYFANIPFFHLPRVHQIFINEGLVDKNRVFTGSLDYLKICLKHEA